MLSIFWNERRGSWCVLLYRLTVVCVCFPVPIAALSLSLSPSDIVYSGHARHAGVVCAPLRHHPPVVVHSKKYWNKARRRERPRCSAFRPIGTECFNFHPNVCNIRRRGKTYTTRGWKKNAAFQNSRPWYLSDVSSRVWEEKKKKKKGKIKIKKQNMEMSYPPSLLDNW